MKMIEIMITMIKQFLHKSSLQQVYRSEWILDTASPDWKPVTLDCAKLCLGDWNRDLRYSPSPSPSSCHHNHHHHHHHHQTFCIVHLRTILHEDEHLLPMDLDSKVVDQVRVVDRLEDTQLVSNVPDYRNI